LTGHAHNTFKRIIYRYYMRDFSVASIELLVGAALSLFGALFGVEKWLSNFSSVKPTASGTIMLAAVPLLIGFQLLLAFLNYDISSVPREAIHPLLRALAIKRPSEPECAQDPGAFPKGERAGEPVNG
jgi:hypothetical protein